LRPEAGEARPDRAERDLLRRELVAVVAAPAGWRAGCVVPLHAAAVLRYALAVLPVADQAPLGKGDGLHLVGFEPLGELGGRAVRGFGAHALYAVLHHALHARLAARAKVALHELLHVFRRRVGERRRERKEREN